MYTFTTLPTLVLSGHNGNFSVSARPENPGQIRSCG